MRLPIFSSVVALFSMVCGALGAPDAGVYAGTVMVSRFLGEEGLMSQYSLRVQARIKVDGSITILSSAPELPRTATVEDAITRAVPVPPPLVPQPQPPTIRFLDTQMPSVTPMIFPLPLLGGSYLVDGKFPAFVSVKGKIVTLSYQNPARPEPEVVIQDGVAEAQFHFAPPAVSFLFTLKKVGK